MVILDVGRKMVMTYALHGVDRALSQNTLVLRKGPIFVVPPLDFSHAHGTNEGEW